MTERAAAAESHEAAQKEISELRDQLVKERERHKHEVFTLKDENEHLKKWTEGLLEELRDAHAKLEASEQA